ncbi:MAG: pyruvate, phosphate dikinase [Thaumarchaeota archaeon]|nr:pyruvate, phosphate dikinase [Nitrososphaerota archaeon]
MSGKRLNRVLSFEEAKGQDRFMLGGKGFGLVEMTSIGLPVPPGFTITTDVCKEYYRGGGNVPSGLLHEVRQKVEEVERRTGRKFGGTPNPLLFSVRSGAPYSMPGMMDTILNLGLSDEAADWLAGHSENPRFVYDSFRRLVQMFGKVAIGVDGELFERELEERRRRAGVKMDIELSAEELREVAQKFKEIIRTRSGREFPQDPHVQLEMSIEAVLQSWNNPRAKEYRRYYGIGDDLGTAVNVQTMVFGNLGDNSGSGVGFTRNPSTGERDLFGEYLPDSQGGDVVSGARTPVSLSVVEPAIHQRLLELTRTLESHFRDMQDFEFTVEKGTLYLLQTRNGKRTPQAAVKIAVDMVEEGLVRPEEAVSRVEPEMLDALLHRRLDPGPADKPLAKGLNASPGAASGKVVFDTDEAAEIGKSEKIILVRPETTPEDIKGMIAAQGVLTVRGGMTSHAAVVARGMGKPAIVGCGDVEISQDGMSFVTRGGEKVAEGDVITIDGTSGNVFRGEVKTIEPEPSPEFWRLLQIADRFKRLGVWANADTPEAAAKALGFGAEGIGLCRTERMFNAPDRLPIVREMIMSKDSEERKRHLYRLSPFQLSDFTGIFSEMRERPVVIRLLDLPLHEFLPPVDELLLEIEKMKEDGASADEIQATEAVLARVRQLSEHNPMLGHRGCRLAVTYPEIYEMQTKAILRAAVEVSRKTGKDPTVKIMIPLVAHVGEFGFLRNVIEKAAAEVLHELGTKMPFQVGTMIETPRAALTAGDIALQSDFFSFGTNDLTQTTFGFSRDDVEAKFIPKYIETGILDRSPFDSVDVAGVGKLVKMAVEQGRKTNPRLEVGICGEHGGDPRSIALFHEAGLDYVSCSSFRVPIARLAAAQAAVAKSSVTTA